MTQDPGSDPAPAKGSGTTDESPRTPAADGQPAAEPAVERSRFSQWLASFGLGEFQNPLLTRTRTPQPRRRAT